MLVLRGGGGDYVTLVTVNSLFYFYFLRAPRVEHAAAKSAGIKAKWAVSLQCDISEAAEMKRGLSFVPQRCGYRSDTRSRREAGEGAAYITR